MANTLPNTAPANIIALRIIDLLVAEYPWLMNIGADFSSEEAPHGTAITIHQPSGFTASDYDPVNGYVASDATLIARTVTINKLKHVTYGFNDLERASSAVPLIERFAMAGASALGQALVTDLLALVTAANFTNKTTGAAAAFSWAKVVEMAQAMDVRKVPSMGRSLVLSSDTYSGIMQDATLVANPGSPSAAVRTGQMGPVFGINTYGCPTIPNNDGTLKGFLCTPSALLLATRVPPLPTNSDFPGTVETVKDTKTGLALQVRTWYEPGKGKEFRTYALNYGVAKGDTDQLQRFATA